MMGFSVAALIVSTMSSEARLGETSIQCFERYGNAKTDAGIKTNDKLYPVLQGAILRTFEHKGWTIRAAFLELDGPAVRVQYQKLFSSGDIQIKDFEAEAILEAYTPTGTTWKKIGPTLVFGHRWERSDGAIAESNHIYADAA